MKTKTTSFFEDRRSESSNAPSGAIKLPKHVRVCRRNPDVERAIFNDHWYLKVNYAHEENNIKNILKQLRANKE